jgi:hypothetical protein
LILDQLQANNTPNLLKLHHCKLVLDVANFEPAEMETVEKLTKICAYCPKLQLNYDGVNDTGSILSKELLNPRKILLTVNDIERFYHAHGIKQGEVNLALKSIQKIVLDLKNGFANLDDPDNAHLEKISSLLRINQTAGQPYRLRKLMVNTQFNPGANFQKPEEGDIVIPKETGLECIELEQYWLEGQIELAVRAYMLRLIQNSAITLKSLALPFASTSFIEEALSVVYTDKMEEIRVQNLTRKCVEKLC